MEIQIKEFQEILGTDQISLVIAPSKVSVPNSPNIQAVIFLQILIWVPEEVIKTTDFLTAAGLVLTGEWAFDQISEFEKKSEVFLLIKSSMDFHWQEFKKEC